MDESGQHSVEKGGVREALADHFVMWHDMGEADQPPGEWRCACGLKFGFSDSAIDHVAEQVQSVLRHDEAEKGRLWQHLRDRCERAETMHAEAFRIGIAKQDQLAAVEALCQRWEKQIGTGIPPTRQPATDLRAALRTPPASTPEEGPR